MNKSSLNFETAGLTQFEKVLFVLFDAVKIGHGFVINCNFLYYK